MAVASSLANGLSYLVGAISLVIWSVLALWDGPLRRRQPGEHDHPTFAEGARRTPAWWTSNKTLNTEIFRIAQSDLWSLSPQAENKLKLQHQFLALPGSQLHYLAPLGSKRRRSDLIIFLHGFPDSCHIFTDLLRSPLADHANLVALDLPGFGGSDGLPNYGANEVLNVISAAIALLKKRHLQTQSGEEARCILVGHDWGSVVASRLAMETQGLIDRLVLVNGVVPRLFVRNIRSGINGCRTSLTAWWRDRSNTAALGEAKEALRPVLAQLVKSNYIFMFRLPFFKMRLFSFVIQYLLSVCHRAAAKNEAEAWSSWSRASSVGPGVAECTKPRNGWAYGQSVLDRALNHPHGDWNTRLRLYRDDLFSGNWNLRDDGVAADGVERVDRNQAKQFQCPASIVFGVRDFALDPRICVRGVKTLFRSSQDTQSAESHIILLEDCGHWSPLEKHGCTVLRELLLEILGVDGEGADLAMQQPRIRRSDFK